MSNFKPEHLAYWYLRLNGFLLWDNFYIHDDSKADQRTDADLIGIRFAHRAEIIRNPMKDDDVVANCSTFCNIIIAEVKTGMCALNGPWTTPGKENIQRVLAAVGCVPESQRDQAAKELYESGRFVTYITTIRLMAFGDYKSTSLTFLPEVPQVLFDDMIEFIYKRFREYRRQKSDVRNWTDAGKKLQELDKQHMELSEFIKETRNSFGLDPVHLKETN